MINISVDKVSGNYLNYLKYLVFESKNQTTLLANIHLHFINGTHNKNQSIPQQAFLDYFDQLLVYHMYIYIFRIHKINKIYIEVCVPEIQINVPNTIHSYRYI